MNDVIRRWLIASAASVVLLIAQSAFADSITLSNNPAPNYDIFAGVYTGPYAATVNGQSVLIVCDDFFHDTNAGQSWTATANQFSSLGNPGVITNWNSTTDPNYLLHYQQAAYLILEMMVVPNTQANSVTIGELAFAVWALFGNNNSQVMTYLNSYASSLPAGFIAGVQKDIANAVSNSANGNYSNLVLYTPPCKGMICGPPQEFFYVPVPEGGSSGAYLSAAFLACFGVMFLRHRHQN